MNHLQSVFPNRIRMWCLWMFLSLSSVFCSAFLPRLDPPVQSIVRGEKQPSVPPRPSIPADCFLRKHPSKTFSIGAHFMAPKNQDPNKNPEEEQPKDPKKAQKEALIRKALQKNTPSSPDEGLLDKLNPFKAGVKLRKTLDTALTSLGSSLPSERRSVYFLDDRFQDQGGAAGSAPLFSERNPFTERWLRDDYIPEVLVIGATGEVGRLVVRRLLLEGKCRVRVLVRDLYSKTLNMLGTGVTYCQGDLGNVESLEYAVTDVDKIVFCAGAPRSDETDFQDKFRDFVAENLEEPSSSLASLRGEQQQQPTVQNDDTEWEQLESVLKLRASLAEQVDCIGMANLVRAYQNVRFADYGSSQAAKRTLFKFKNSRDDLNLFDLDVVDNDDNKGNAKTLQNKETSSISSRSSAADEDIYGEFDDYDTMEGYYEDDVDPYAYYDEAYGNQQTVEEATLETRRDSTVQMQARWMQNQFGRGVFVGKVPKLTDTGVGGEAAIVSTKLSSREDPENGIDLSNGFGGFICRVCADGGRYEAFIRTGAFERDGIEYVCEFSTATKEPQRRKKSRNKFLSVRLPFENFKPVARVGQAEGVVPPFNGKDVRNIGFRYRSASNTERSKLEAGRFSSFYLALDYIKIYRSQLEPEFVYLSDARIPPIVGNGMVRHDLKQLVSSRGNDGDVVRILDDSELKTVTSNKMERSSEETYFKYRGEEILKKSGLSYAVVRVSGYNESPSGEASTIGLKPLNDDVAAVSRAEVAEVCVNSLLDPNALNKSFYVTKVRAGGSVNEDMSSKFASLPSDLIQ